MANDIVSGTAPTSTATSAATEPEVVAGISSGAPRDVAPEPARRWHLAHRLALLASGIALGYAASLLLRRSDAQAAGDGRADGPAASAAPSGASPAETSAGTGGTSARSAATEERRTAPRTTRRKRSFSLVPPPMTN